MAKHVPPRESPLRLVAPQAAAARQSDVLSDVLANFVDDHPAFATLPVALLYAAVVEHAPVDASRLEPYLLMRPLSFSVRELARLIGSTMSAPRTPRLRDALPRVVNDLAREWPPSARHSDAAVLRAAAARESGDLVGLLHDVFGQSHTAFRGSLAEALSAGGEVQRLATAALALRAQVRAFCAAPVAWPVFVDDDAPYAQERRALLADIAPRRSGRALAGWMARRVQADGNGADVILANAYGETIAARIDVRRRAATCFRDAAIPAAWAAVYDLVNEPAPRDLHLVELWCRPRYDRVLAALDAFVDADAAPAREERLIWVIGDRWSSLQLECRKQKRKAAGKGFTKGTVMSASAIAVDPCASDADQRAAVALGPDNHRPNVRAALLALAGQDAIVVDDNGAPVAVDAATLAVALRDRDDGGVDVVFRVDERIDLDPENIVTPATIIRDGDAPTTRFLVAPVTARHAALARAVADEPTIPAAGRAAVEKLADRTAATKATALVLPPSLTGELTPGAPRLVVRLALTDPLTLTARIAAVAGDGAAFDVPGVGADVALALKDGKRVRYPRDLTAEQQGARALLAALCDGVHVNAVDDDAYAVAAVDDDALDLFRRVQSCGSEIVWRDQRRLVTVENIEASRLKVRVTSARSWLGVDGEASVDGETLSLATLLAAVRHQRRYVQLKGDRFAAVDDALRDALRGVAALAVDEAAEDDAPPGERRDRGVVVPVAVAPALDALDAAGAVFESGAVWRQMRARLDRARAVDDAPPQGLTAELRPYQRDGVLFLRRLAAFGTGGVLADDMGLGKTIQAIALLLDRASAGPALVVAPTSLVFNWQREIERFAPSLNVHIYGDANDRAALRAAQRKKDVLIVSYGLVDDAFADVAFATAVFDEAQAIKNADTQRARACRDVQADIKIALSGTPLENHLGELWSLFTVVSPGLLGSAEQFRKRFLLPIERDRSVQHRHQLAATLRPFLLRRTKQEVLPELPALTHQLIDVEAPPAARAFYDALRAEILADLDDGAGVDDRRFRVLAGLTRLRLCCCHPVLVEPSYVGGSAKLDAAVATLEQVKSAGHKALVFSQFVKFLDLVEPALVAAGLRVLRLDGSTPQAERRTRVDAFQRGEADIFLLSLKAGGAGLNLTAADVVVHLDPWWNPAVEAQAIARAHRMGRAAPVTAIRFVVRDTIEEAILQLHDDKRELVDSVLAGSGGGAALGLDEIAALLRGAGG